MVPLIGLSLTYDGEEGFCPGWLESTPLQRGLTDIEPRVGRGGVADGEAPPEAVEPAGESHSVSLPVHAQLFHRPVRARALVTMIVNHVDGNNNNFRHSAQARQS